MQKNDELVERVAKAIHAEQDDRAWLPYREHYKRVARAALAVARPVIEAEVIDALKAASFETDYDGKLPEGESVIRLTDALAIARPIIEAEVREQEALNALVEADRFDTGD